LNASPVKTLLFESFTEDQELKDQEQENQEQDHEQEDQEQEDQEQENKEQDQEQEDQEQEDQEQEDQEQEDQEQEDQEQHGGLVVNCSQRVTSPQDNKVQIDPVYMKESAVLDGDKEALVDEDDTIVDKNDGSHVSAPVGDLSANLTGNSDRKYLAAGDMKEMVLVKGNIPSGPRSPQSTAEITEGGDRGSSPILRYISTVAVIILLYGTSTMQLCRRSELCDENPIPGKLSIRLRNWIQRF
jgi:hypothetical protein